MQKFSGESIRGRLKKVEIDESYSDLVAESLGQCVFGQEEACRAVARIITIFEASLSDPSRPAGVVMFLGPTGTGKSEMGEAAATQLFGDNWKKHYRRIDCSDYSESHILSRFIGSPPGYVGYGDETVFNKEFLDEKNVIVFDEIEKANVALWRMLLGIFENGKLDARTGIGDGDTAEEELKFTNSLIILTSNAGAEQMQESQRVGLGFINKNKAVDVKNAAMSGLKQHFSQIPEFLGRVDEFVVFKALEKDTYIKIYWKFVQEISELMANVGVYFTTTNELAEHLVEKAVKSGEYGARDIRHVLHQELVLTLADLVTSNTKVKGVVADVEGDKVVFFDLTEEMEESECLQPKVEVEKDEFITEKQKSEDVEVTKSADDLKLEEIIDEYDLFRAISDGYEWVIEDEVVGKIMEKLLHLANYDKWKKQAERIKYGGDDEKKKTVRVLGDALRMMESKDLRRLLPEEWKVYKSVLDSFEVKVD